MPELKKLEENKKFNRFWNLIQETAAKEKAKFFMDAGEGNELVTEDFEGENFSGWLIPTSSANIFEYDWEIGNAHQDIWDDFYCYAEWKKENGAIIIEFNCY